MLDTLQRVTTPEGIELNLQPAGPAPRALAWMLDLLWRYALLIGLSMLLLPLGEVGVGLFLISWFALEWLVPAALEVHFEGATPGKKALGLMVVRDDGAPVGWGEALTRNLLRFADFLPFGYFGGLLSMIGSKGFKRLGDHAAGTVVVYRPPPSVQLVVPLEAPQPPPVGIDLEGRRAILDFAERSTRLTPERAEEIAAVLVAKIGMLAHESPAQRLIAVANHLLGKRAGEDSAAHASA